MRVISTTLFFFFIQAYFPALGSLPVRLIIDGKSVEEYELTKPTLDRFMDSAVAQYDHPTTPKYHRYRPLVTKGWEKKEDAIRMIVNEAAYTFKYAEDVLESFKRERGKEDKNFEEILNDLLSPYRDVLTLAKAKAFEIGRNSRNMMTKNPNQIQEDVNAFALREKSGKDVELTDTDLEEKMKGPLLHTSDFDQESSGDRSIHQSISPYGTAADHEIIVNNVIQGLRTCILRMEDHPKFDPNFYWSELVQRSIFQGIEYLYKYNFIGKEGIKMFFDGDRMLQITGRHLKNTVYLNEAFFQFPLIPQEKYEIFDWQADYLRHCLGGLDVKSQKTIIQTVFSQHYKELQYYGESKGNWPKLDPIVETLTHESFLENLPNWKPNSKESEWAIKLDENVAQLIIQFVKPWEHFTQNELRSNWEAFRINTHMLEFLTRNLSPQQSLQGFFANDMYLYKQFQSQLRFIETGEHMVLLFEREKFLSSNLDLGAGNHGLCSLTQLEHERTILLEEISKLQMDQNALKLEIENGKETRAWKDQAIVKYMLDFYAKYTNFKFVV